MRLVVSALVVSALAACERAATPPAAPIAKRHFGAYAGSTQSQLAPPPGGQYVAVPYVTGMPTQPGNPAISALGIAFDSAGNLFACVQGHGLYKYPPGGGPSQEQYRLTAYPTTAPFAIVFKGSRAYVDDWGSPHRVLEINPATGAALRTVAGLSFPGGMAIDPISGDLFVTAAFAGNTIVRVSPPEAATPNLSVYFPGCNDGCDGLSFAPDGTLFAAQRNKVFSINRSGALTATYFIGGADGVGVGTDPSNPLKPSYVLVNSNGDAVHNNQGFVSKVDLTKTPPVITDVLTGGSRGDIVAVGPDGCMYATQSDSIVKITRSDGSCSLASTDPLEASRLTLSPDTSVHEIGQTVTLTAHASDVRDRPVVGAQLTLTIASGPDAGPLPSATTDANGNATVTLRGTKLGTDVVRASAAGGLLRSNDALATWTAPSPCSVAQTN